MKEIPKLPNIFLMKRMLNEVDLIIDIKSCCNWTIKN